MSKEKGLIETAMDEMPEMPYGNDVEIPNGHTYFVSYVCEAMGKKLIAAKIFKFDTAITASTFDSISASIAAHENVATVTITNFQRVEA